MPSPALETGGPSALALADAPDASQQELALQDLQHNFQAAMDEAENLPPELGTDDKEEDGDLDDEDAEDSDLAAFYVEEETAFARENAKLAKELARASKFNDKTFRGKMFRISQYSWFQRLFAVLIFLNVFMVVISADALARLVEDPEDSWSKLVAAFVNSLENFFIAAFVVEITIRLLGSPVKIWTDGWLMMDSLIVALAVLDVWILGLLFPDAQLSNVAIVRALRVTRIFRGARLLRLLQLVRQIKVLTSALAEAGFRAAWMYAVTVFCSWCCAIVLTVWLGNLPPPEFDQGLILQILDAGEQEQLASHMHFGSFGANLLLFNMVILRAIRWGPVIVWPMLCANDWRYNVGGALVVLNIGLALLIGTTLTRGVFVCSLIEAAQTDQALVERASQSKRINIDEMKEFFREMCSTHTTANESTRTYLTWESFMSGVEDYPAFKKIITTPGAKAAHIRDELMQAWTQLDINNNGHVNLDEFVVGLLKLTRASSSTDFMHMEWQQIRTMSQLHKIHTMYYANTRILRRYSSDFGDRLGEVVKSSDKLSTIAEKILKGAEDSDSQALLALPQSGAASCEASSLQAKLDSRFNFGDRLKRVEQRIRALHARPREVDKQIADTLDAVMQEVLQEDAFPWLQERLAASAIRNSGSSVEPPTMTTSQSPVASPAVPSTGIPQSFLPASSLEKVSSTAWQRDVPGDATPQDHNANDPTMARNTRT